VIPFRDGAVTTTADSSLWTSVDALLAAATPYAARAHGLGPLYARHNRKRNKPVPAGIAAEEQLIGMRMLMVAPLLERIRAICTGPLVLMKGAEVALNYPDFARSFSDVDILVPEPGKTRGELLAAGFDEVGDPELFYRIHHLRPLAWPLLPIAVEIHKAPKWPARLRAPEAADIINSAQPSRLGVEGVLAPRPAQHALLLATHAWAHEPLLRARDLLDVLVMSAQADTDEIERTARRWGIRRLWRTTYGVAGEIFGSRGKTLAARLWARHLLELRERTVLENHVQAWLSGYWALPPRAALEQNLAALHRNLTPAPEEGWRDKLDRSVKALRNAGSPLSQHDLLLGEAATRGQGRNLPDEDDLADERRAGSD
jgi:hypothetical protein